MKQTPAGQRHPKSKHDCYVRRVFNEMSPGPSSVLKCSLWSKSAPDWWHFLVDTLTFYAVVKAMWWWKCRISHSNSSQRLMLKLINQFGLESRMSCSDPAAKKICLFNRCLTSNTTLILKVQNLSIDTHSHMIYNYWIVNVRILFKEPLLAHVLIFKLAEAALLKTLYPSKWQGFCSAQLAPSQHYPHYGSEFTAHNVLVKLNSPDKVH